MLDFLKKKKTSNGWAPPGASGGRQQACLIPTSTNEKTPLPLSQINNDTISAITISELSSVLKKGSIESSIKEFFG